MLSTLINIILWPVKWLVGQVVGFVLSAALLAFALWWLFKKT